MTTPNPSEMVAIAKAFIKRFEGSSLSEGKIFADFAMPFVIAARSEGYRAGIEAAAKVAEEFQTVEGEPSLLMTNLATAIRRLAEEDE